jgi:hypothetical protein
MASATTARLSTGDLLQDRNRVETADKAASEARDEFATRGFVHIKSIVPASRVEDIKREAQVFGKAQNVHETPIFGTLLDELRVQQTVQHYVAKDIYYFGWSAIRPADAAREHHYHDDAKGFPIATDSSPIALMRKQSSAHDATKDPTWPVYRLFIYLDDHENFSGGTKFRARSHKRHSLFTKQGLRALVRLRFAEILIPGAGYANPPVRPGDAILFNLKCKHSGYFVRLRWPLNRIALPTFWDNVIKRLTLNSRLGRGILSLFARPFRETRTSIIIDFCSDSDWSRGFQINRVLHPNNFNRHDQLFDCNRPEFVARLAGSQVRVLENPLLHRLQAWLASNQRER